jgi:lysine 2,3-aminomutase
MSGRTYHVSDRGRAPRESPIIGATEVLAARPGLSAAWEAADALFTVQITRSFWDRSDPSDPSDPLLRQVLPDPAELVPDAGDLDDPVGEKALSPVPWVVCKHPDRVLLLMTKRCHLYCRYCFRRTHAPGEGLDPTDVEWEAALAWAERSGAEEVILSGGDPLATSDARLFATIDRLRPAIPVVRVHTRAPITEPRRVTTALVDGLRARRPVWVVVHCNHPAELSPDVDHALARLVDAGVPVLNQSVLLRGVNDDAEVLAELSRQLVRRGVFPYYLHQADAVTGNAHFRVPLDEGRRIVADLRRLVSGIGLPSWVVDAPDGSGKVPVELRAS